MASVESIQAPRPGVNSKHKCPLFFPKKDIEGGTENVQQHTNAGETVKEILKKKRGSIKDAELEEGSPTWAEIQDLTWEEIVERAKKDQPGYRTIKKLLGEKRFDK